MLWQNLVFCIIAKGASLRQERMSRKSSQTLFRCFSFPLFLKPFSLAENGQQQQWQQQPQQGYPQRTRACPAFLFCVCLTFFFSPFSFFFPQSKAATSRARLRDSSSGRASRRSRAATAASRSSGVLLVRISFFVSFPCLFFSIVSLSAGQQGYPPQGQGGYPPQGG